MSHVPPNGSPYYYPGAPGPPPAGGYAYVPASVMMPVYPAPPPHHPPPPPHAPPPHHPPPSHYPPTSQYPPYYPPPPQEPAPEVAQPTYVTNYVYQQPPQPAPTPPPPPPPTVTIIESPQPPAITIPKPWQAIAGIAEACLSEVNKVIGNNQETTQTIHVIHGESVIDWVPATTSSTASLTHRAFVGGKEGWDSSPLWIIRAHHSGELVPGKFTVKQRAAFIPHGGREIPVHNFEVLCAPQNSLRWMPASNGQVPVGAIPAGNTHNAEPLYIARCKHMRSTTPGKVHPSHGTAYISYGGSEITYRNYEVLCKIVG